MSFSAAQIWPSTCGSGFTYEIDWQTSSTVTPQLQIDSVNRRVYGTETRTSLVDNTFYAKIKAYTFVDGKKYETSSMNQFCVHVIPGDCNVVEIENQSFSETLTVMLDETKTINLADYGLPWSYTPASY